jgi:hypothetical protein
MISPVSFFFLAGVRGFEDPVDCCEAGGTLPISCLEGELVGCIWLEALKEVAGVTGKLGYSGIGA